MKKALIVALLAGLLVVAAYGVFAHQNGVSLDGYSNSDRDEYMDEMHDYMVSGLDPQTADYMNQMHNACHYD